MSVEHCDACEGPRTDACSVSKHAAQVPRFVAAIQDYKRRTRAARELAIPPRPGARFLFYYSGDSRYEAARREKIIAQLEKAGTPASMIHVETLAEHNARKGLSL